MDRQTNSAFIGPSVGRQGSNKRYDDVIIILKTSHEKINTPFDEENVGRAGRVGNEYTDKNTENSILEI